MAKATHVRLHRAKVGPEVVAAAFVLLVISVGAALLTVWLGFGG